MSRFEKLHPASLRSQIAERIREAVLDGSLVEGERLIERRLADDFGASLTAVREALVELETEGFIAKLPNSSTHVISVTEEDAEKILSAREVLEGFALSEAARRATPGQQSALMALQSGVLAAAAARDLKSFLLRDLALHQAGWEISQNEHTIAALRRLALPFYAFCALRFNQLTASELSLCAEANLPFLNGICTHDPDAARGGLVYTLSRWLEKARIQPECEPTPEPEPGPEPGRAGRSLLFGT
ncbi:MAG: GntR family transcriptional regulator [Bryobacteraceae bacterium]